MNRNYSQQDIEDIFYIDKCLNWLESELKSGAPMIDHIQGHVLWDVVMLDEYLSTKYNENHKPAGSPNSTGGQFDFSPENGGAGQRGGGGRSEPTSSSPKPSGPSTPKRTIDHAIREIEKTANKAPTGWCAQYVRKALAKSNIIVNPPPARPGKIAAQARDYGPSLLKTGFESVLTRTQPATAPQTEKLQKGDVAIIQATSRNEAGHMAIYNGRLWISDYVQPGFWPGDAYRNEKPGYVIYRLPSEERAH